MRPTAASEGCHHHVGALEPYTLSGTYRTAFRVHPGDTSRTGLPTIGRLSVSPPTNHLATLNTLDHSPHLRSSGPRRCALTDANRVLANLLDLWIGQPGRIAFGCHDLGVDGGEWCPNVVLIMPEPHLLELRLHKTWLQTSRGPHQVDF